MRNSLPQNAQKYLKEYLHEKRWKCVVTVLACIVVFCTTYALILPALTMTGDTFCGIEAHQHSDECYENILICGQEENEAREFATAHTHTDACYEMRSVLVCGQEESDSHMHDDSCYDADGNLICGQEESLGHLHTEACYQAEDTLTCNEKESALPEETEGHVHTDACYEKILICEKEEHEHTLACYSNPDADIESESVWARSVSGVHLTGVWADDVVAVAQTQLGYAESTENYIVTDDGEMKGISRFGQWYGNPYGDWDAMFVSFCLNYAGIPQTAVPYGVDYAEWVNALSNAGLYRSGSTYSPAKGDIVFFDDNGDGAVDHVGLVVKSGDDASSFSTIEGDTDNRVQRVLHSTGENAIIGYVALPENPDYVPADSDTPNDEQPVDNDVPTDEEPANDSNDALQPEEQNGSTEGIALGETKTIAVGAGEIVNLQFVPDYSHEYTFYSSTSGDTYGYLYNADMKTLKTDDDGAGNRNFKVTYTLNGGETYYWGTKWYNSSSEGDITVHLDLGTNHVYIENDQGQLVCACGAIAPESGMCGDDLYWSFDKETGVLSITGTGAMAKYSSSAKAPWAHFSDQIKTVNIGEGASSIGDYAFYNCTALETVTFPGTLKNIGLIAFRGCSALKEADLSETGVTFIGASAFRDCASLENVLFPNPLRNLSGNAFDGCKSLKQADLSSTSLTSISSYAFQGCYALEKVDFPTSLTTIDQSAFSGCRAIKEIDLSGTKVEKINESVFSRCASLERVVFPQMLTDIGRYSFSGCSALTEVDMSSTAVSSIEYNAFNKCSSLETVRFPNTLQSIEAYAFSECTSLPALDLSDTAVTSIGYYAFSSCRNLSELVIPKTTRSAEQNLFYNCDSLTELRLEAADITINPTQVSVKNGFHVTVAETVERLPSNTITALKNMGCNSISFEGPSYLTAGGWQADFLPDRLNDLPQSEYFIDGQGVFYRIDSETNTASVFYCPPGIETYTVPKELPATDGKETPIPVTSVDSYAFSDASDLTELTFEAPDAVTSLADLAFYRAVNLASINGQSDSAAVLGTFTSDDLKTGTMLFWRTKIADGSEQPSGDALVVEKKNLKLTISTDKSKYLDPSQSEDGTYLYYTGEAAKTTITVSNPDSSQAGGDNVARVYFRFAEKGGKLNYIPGTYTVVSTGGNKYTMRVVQTDTVGCYYVELECPTQGDTISIILESSYPSPSSGGGSATLWCDILTNDEKASIGNGLIPADTHQNANWSTVPDTFPITKSEKSTDASKLVGDGGGGAYISDLSYVVSMSREGTTLEGIGKDYMSSVDFDDVLTLPEGVTLAEDVLQALRNGTVKIDAAYGSQGGYQFKTEDGRVFLTITPNNAYKNYEYLQNGSASLDENGNLVIHWGFRNADLNTEIGATTFTYTVADNTLVVSNPQEDKVYVVDNSVTAKQHFMYSKDQEQQAECSASVKTAKSSLELKKNYTTYSGVFGEPRGYRITAQNPGAMPYEGLASLTDDLPSELYMRPVDIASTFEADTEHQLTLKIINATLCKPHDGKTVSGIDGTAAVTNAQNTGSGTEYRGMSGADTDRTSSEASTITVAWGTDGNLQISIEGGTVFSCAPEENAICSVLESLSLVVTPKTQYCLKWDLRDADGTVPSLPGGGKIEKNIFCSNKDTFMLLSNDARNEHPNRFYYAINYGCGRDQNGKILKSDNYNNYIDREFYLGKNWSMNGQTVNADTVIRQGDVLDYALNVKHSGNAQYNALPLADHMSGTQALLAPVEKNSVAEWAQGLQTITDNGEEYYVLNKPGTYHNVWTSEDKLADTVEVTQAESGLDTLIKWYFVNYTGYRTDNVAYRSYVCPEETATGSLTYSLNNESWLNDHQSHRLYATLPGWEGTAFAFDKVIVDAVGDNGAGYIHSSISEGQTVVYRLMLSSPTDKDGNELPMQITGKDMYDALPLSNNTYRWNKENVRITYMDDYTVTNGDNWSVEEPKAGNQQYIQWAEDFSISFTGTAYIYVELDFPSEIPWQEYASKYGATTLVNTFYVLSAQRSVTHDVAIAAQVRLQKGVADTGFYYSSSSYVSDQSIQDDRLYYQNNDIKTRAVRYYAALYNAGPTNLYLTDMQDLLPRGFTYSGSSSLSTSTGTGSYTVMTMKPSGYASSKKYVAITATCSTDENGRQRIVFHFTLPNSTSSSLISYDEARGMCYLKPGESIDFTYICKTNEAADTDDAALNTIVMPYYDFNNSGVNVDDQCKIIAPNSDKYTPNNGGCDVLDNGQAESLGFTGGTNDTQWLASDVTLIRGDIKPGITKALTSKTDQNGITTQNPISAASSDVLNWTVKTENDGTNSIVDYVLTDRMQAPYMFTGEVSYKIYDSPSSKNMNAKPSSDYLFTITSGAQDGVLSIKTNRNNVYTLTVGGDPITLSCGWSYNMRSETSVGDRKAVGIQLSIVKDAEGNATMSLRFQDETMAIPENGYSELTLSTYNATNTLANKQFINTSFVTPLAQVWDGTANKGNVVTLDTPFGNGAIPSVRNSAHVTTSYGYVTGSSKQVSEVENPDNTAACTDEPNYIVLGNKTKQFRYTITVDNSTPKAMDMLVLIDGLPEVGDHTAFLASDLRFSEFKVRLAHDPSFSVTVTDNEKNTTVLDAENYTIEYSMNTEFTNEDWKGTSQWSSSDENARSIRLKIIDLEGKLIPAGSTVSLSFICEIDDPNAQPGQTAWNSFGYHYSLVDEDAELEAAPLKVGVRIPSVPELRKQLVDHSGQPYIMAQDETFQFLVYPGAALSGEYTTREELIKALGDTPYEVFDILVKAGESLSEATRLQTDKWTWTDGQQYTVVELPCNSNYTFKRFLNSPTGTYTLTYTAAQTQIITCENTNLLWSIDLTKENTSHEPLGGAVFALYSPDASDQLSAVPEEYASLNIALTVEHNGKTWYLVSLQTTAEDGTLHWEDLRREEYYLLEVKAPNGYNLNSPAGQILKQEDETQGAYSVTVVNRAGSSLPETGGIGTHLYALGGLLLLLSAGALLLYQRTRRRKEDGTSD